MYVVRALFQLFALDCGRFSIDGKTIPDDYIGKDGCGYRVECEYVYLKDLDSKKKYRLYKNKTYHPSKNVQNLNKDIVRQVFVEYDKRWGKTRERKSECYIARMFMNNDTMLDVFYNELINCLKPVISASDMDDFGIRI